jgi:hypothetical protein
MQVSAERSAAGNSNEDSIHVHLTKKPHSTHSPATSQRSDHNAEVYCVTHDGRLIIFKLEMNPTSGIGDFAHFTRKLEVWVPLRCESCGLTQVMDMGVAHVDEDDSEKTIDSGKTRIYGGRFACPGCSQTIRIAIKFEYYASAGRFSREITDSGRIIHLAGLRDFFRSAKEASIPGRNSETSEKQGSLMHFG